MITREDKIKQKAIELSRHFIEFGCDLEKLLIDAMEWADEHPISGEQIAAMKNEINYLKRKLVEHDKMYRELQNENPWRDARTDTPIDGTDVLCQIESGTKRVGYYCERNKTWYLYGWGPGKVTHWMQIPELPKTEE